MDKTEKREMKDTCRTLRKQIMSEYDELKKLKDNNSITDADLDYALARDRKSALALKTILVELNVERVSNRRLTQ